MRITITQEFDSVEAAAVFLARVGNPAHVVERLTADPVPTLETEKLSPALRNIGVTMPSTRKPRADAGKKREPYGPRAQNAEGTQTGTEPSTRAGPSATDGSAKSADKAAPSAPTPAAPLGEAASLPAANAATASAPAAAATNDAAPTLADARAALKKLNDAPGKGTEACLAALRAFGVVRISDVKSEQYPDFIKHVLAELPAVPK